MDKAASSLCDSGWFLRETQLGTMDSQFPLAGKALLS